MVLTKKKKKLTLDKTTKRRVWSSLGSFKKTKTIALIVEPVQLAWKSISHLCRVKLVRHFG